MASLQILWHPYKLYIQIAIVVLHCYDFQVHVQKVHMHSSWGHHNQACCTIRGCNSYSQSGEGLYVWYNEALEVRDFYLP